MILPFPVREEKNVSCVIFLLDGYREKNGSAAFFSFRKIAGKKTGSTLFSEGRKKRYPYGDKYLVSLPVVRRGK